MNMKILMICGSPRPQKSTSHYLLNILKERLSDDNEVLMCSMAEKNSDIERIVLDNAEDVDVMVVAFPLYVDSIPGSFLKVLKNIEEQIKKRKVNCKLYVIVNNGFYDAIQNNIALDIMWNWCKKCGMTRGRAMGVGAGEMVQGIPLGAGPLTNLGHTMDKFTEDIRHKNTDETIFVEPNFPRFLYKTAAHIGWHKTAKHNGLKVSDIKKTDIT